MNRFEAALVFGGLCSCSFLLFVKLITTNNVLSLLIPTALSITLSITFWEEYTNREYRNLTWKCWIWGHKPQNNSYPFPGDESICLRCGENIVAYMVDDIAYTWQIIQRLNTKNGDRTMKQEPDVIIFTILCTITFILGQFMVSDPFSFFNFAIPERIAFLKNLAGIGSISGIAAIGIVHLVNRKEEST